MNKKIALSTMSALIGASIFNDSKYNSFGNKKIPTKRPKSKLQKKSRKQNRNKK